MRKLFVVLLLGLLVFGCVNPPTTQNNSSKPPVITPVNNTSISQPNTTKPGLPAGYTLGLGDQASVWYTLWVNGTVIDTNNATLANESGIYNPKRAYVPLNFSVEFNKGLIDGFIFGVVGMRVNETLFFNVSPDRGYGPYDLAKVITIGRYYNKSLYETVPRSYFEDKNITIQKGEGFDTQYGTVFIDDFNDENVTIFYLLTPGANVTVNGIPQQVKELTNLSATMEYMFVENRSYVLPNPQTGLKANYRVLSKTEDNITLDSNHPLANETLRFRVTLISAVPVSQRPK
ncbi:MAG TPA: FKBP-type peptidyl-prolyl cis-trans isomerase [Candidatus Bilamarchaeum sp.]|nr:FKBP-type peptidyl-prolyl cis-trans isomerase [Candidatus Bilamarchaeum sp.]